MGKSDVFLALVVLIAVPSATAQSLAGTVVEDRAHTPIPSAEIRIYKTGVRNLAADLETDGNGHFEASGLTEGEYRIEVSKPNHLNTTLQVHLNAGETTNLALHLIRCGIIAGQVVDGKNQPVPGAHVFALRGNPGALRRELSADRFSTVDERGRYRLFNLPPGQYTVAVTYGASTFSVGSMGSGSTPANFGSGVLYYPSNSRPQPFTITDGDEFRNTDFLVLPSTFYSVSGKVQSAPSVRNEQYWVALAPIDQPGLAAAVAIAKPDGTFSLNGVPPGAYHLFASGPTSARGMLGAILSDDAFYARSTVTVGAENVADVALAPQKGRSISFEFATLPACAQTADILLRPVEDWGADLARRIKVTAGKATTTAGLAPARYVASIPNAGEACYVPGELVIDLTGKETPPFTVKAVLAGAIQGHLERPVRASDFVIVLADLTDQTRPVQVAAPGTDANFTFTHLRPGRYRIAAKRMDNPRSSWLNKEGAIDIEVPGGPPVKATVTAPPEVSQ